MSDIAAQDIAWFRMRANIAAAIWRQMARKGMTPGMLAERAKVPRVRDILAAGDMGLDTSDLFRLAWALGCEWTEADFVEAKP